MDIPLTARSRSGTASINRTRSKSRSRRLVSYQSSDGSSVMRRRNTMRRLSSVLQKAFSSTSQEEDPDTTGSNVHQKPESLYRLCCTTKFSKKEIQVLYRCFKEGCPSGALTFEQFKEIYVQFFPRDPGQYGMYIFNAFDRDKNGKITFEEFVINVSILCRGTTEEKLQWVFELYDIDQDGLLRRRDIEKIIASIYEMMGSYTNPPIQADSVQTHTDYIFEKMDGNKDGVITKDEFVEFCQQDECICQSLGLFEENTIVL